MTGTHPITTAMDRLMWCNFTDRESYITWRTEWRAAYREVSELGRALRLAAAAASQRRAGVPIKNAKVAAGLVALEAKILQDSNLRYFYGFDYGKHWCRMKATAMMKIRANSKEKAKQQYLSAKSPQATATLQSTAPSLEVPVRVAV